MTDDELKTTIVERQILVRLQNARDTLTNWIDSNPTLLNGEIAVVNDTVKNIMRIKIGDGYTRFNDLPYYDNVSLMGVANGLATLDAKGKVPYIQLPDTVVELDANGKIPYEKLPDSLWKNGTGSSSGGGSTPAPPVELRAIDKYPVQSGILTYNSNPQSPTWDNYHELIEVLTGTVSSTDAGEYTALFTPAQGFKWPDNTTTAKPITWSIQKNTATLDLSKDTVSLLGTGSTDTVTLNTNVEKNYTADVDNSNVTASISDKVLTVTSTALGSSVITVSHTDSNFTDISKTINVSVKMPADASPTEIKSLIASGNAQNCLSIGDSSACTLNGTCLSFTASNLQTTAQILGFDHNKDLETAGKHAIHYILGRLSDKDIFLIDSSFGNYVTTGFIMNPKNDSRFQSDNNAYSYGFNKGGWKDSHMRNTVMSTLLNNCFPTSLKSAISNVTKYTDNVAGTTNNNVQTSVTATSDKLFLLSEFEVHGTRSYANQYEQNKQLQYDFYKNGNSKVRYKYNSLSDAHYWWLRSPHYSYTYFFCSVYSSGSAGNAYAARSCGVSPAWILGES